MKKAFMAAYIISFLCPGISAGSDYGLGVSLKSSDASIYIPIKLSDNFLFEPYLRYSSYDRETSQAVVDIEHSYRRNTLEAGAGIFRLLNNNSDLMPYYGVRVGYIDREEDYEYKSGSTEHFSNINLSGYSLAPAVGVNYKVIKNLHIGLEAEWYYLSVDGNGEETVIGVESYTDTIKGDESATGTNTKIIIRYFF